MKKILYLADGYKVDRHPLEFAGFVCNLLKSPLAGLFVEPASHDAGSEMALREEIVCSGIALDHQLPLAELKQECLDRNLTIFRSACDDAGINGHAEVISDHVAATTLLECRYADLLLIDPAMGLTIPSAAHTPSMTRNILSQAECPVILAPERFDGLEEILFAYDASPSAVFAIKQFRALFPKLSDRKLTVLTAGGEANFSKNELQRMAEWLRENYGKVNFVNAGIDSRIALMEYALEKEKLIVVMGAYGRNGWSTFLSSSHAEPLAKFISIPIFISHL